MAGRRVPTVELDVTQVRRNLKRLGDAELGRVLSKAINGVAFDVRDAERKEVLESLEVRGRPSERYLAGRSSFVFDPAKPDRLRAVLFPRKSRDRQRERILAEQQRGARISGAPGEAKRLEEEELLAVPIHVKRGRSGRVRAKDTPSRLLEEGRAWRSGNAIRTRLANGEVVTLFALVPAFKLAPVFDFYRAARDTARKRFPFQVRKWFARIRLGIR